MTTDTIAVVTSHAMPASSDALKALATDEQVVITRSRRKWNRSAF